MNHQKAKVLKKKSEIKEHLESVAQFLQHRLKPQRKIEIRRKRVDTTKISEWKSDSESVAQLQREPSFVSETSFSREDSVREAYARKDLLQARVSPRINNQKMSRKSISIDLKKGDAQNHYRSSLSTESLLNSHVSPRDRPPNPIADIYPTITSVAKKLHAQIKRKKTTIRLPRLQRQSPYRFREPE